MRISYLDRAARPSLLVVASVAVLGVSTGLVLAAGGGGRLGGRGSGSASSATTLVLGGGVARSNPSAGDGSPKSFGISGRVDGLYPGGPAPLTLTFSNPNSSPVRVTQVSITVAAASTRCPGTLLSFTSLSPVVVPAKGTATGQVSASLSPSTGDSCQGVLWKLTYSGTAVKA